jgi:hypothetical protein
MQVPLISGAYADQTAGWRTAYPRNMIPVPKEQGISKGYFRPGEGLEVFAGAAPGVDRGAIVWRGQCYRVMGTKLVSVSASGVISVLGDVGGSGHVTFDYSFDRLGIGSGGNLFYWDGTLLTEVTDPDLGTVVDVLWVDGYWLTTDGVNLVATELNDPTSINPLKYGSSEADPDAVVALWKLRNEVHAINRYTTEVYDNVGGNGFPLQRIDGALIECGAIGTHATCLYGGSIAVLGGARNEPPSVWLIGGGNRIPLATSEIDQILAGYSEEQLKAALLEARTWRKHEWLYVHLPDRCLVFDIVATKVLGESVWFSLDSGVLIAQQYRAQHWVWCYDEWLAGDPAGNAVLKSTDAHSMHLGQSVGWDLQTAMFYNAGRGAVIHELELVALPGRVAFGADPQVWTSYTVDGETWSMERPVGAGVQGDRAKRLRWLQQGLLSNYRAQRFRGTSDAHLSVSRLEAQVEPLGV